jgi:hypothetical protein
VRQVDDRCQLIAFLSSYHPPQRRPSFPVVLLSCPGLSCLLNFSIAPSQASCTLKSLKFSSTSCRQVPCVCKLQAFPGPQDLCHRNIPGILNPRLSSLDCFPSIKFLTFKWFHKSQPLGNSQDVCNRQRPTRGRYFTDEQRHCPVSGLCVGQIALQRACEPRCVRILVSL